MSKFGCAPELRNDIGLTLSLHKKLGAEASRVEYKARTEYFMD